MICRTRRGSLASSLVIIFFCFRTFAFPADPDVIEQVAESPLWHALLQLTDGQPNLKGQDFLLSASDFSPKNELIKTIELLLKHPEGACQFPARRYFILEALDWPSQNIPIDHCSGFLEYLDKAPADSFSLVYTSENLYSPSSMMGHIMLKMDGHNYNDQPVSHGISFFTEIEGFNVPKILWDSLFVGKSGFFQIAPYQEKLDYYLNKEQRSIWEYKLTLSESDKTLIQAHFWELKNVAIPYFFHTYNCATVTQLVIAIANPELGQRRQNWLTPLDVVKNTHAAGLVESTVIIPASEWKLRMLQEALPPKTLTEIRHFVLSDDTDYPSALSPEEAFLISEAASTYNEFLVEKRGRLTAQYQDTKQQIEKHKGDQFRGFNLDISNYKNPLDSPPDSQISLGLIDIEDGKTWLDFTYLPASHTIEEDSRQFFSDSALQLSSLSIWFSPEDGDIKLNEWLLYSMRSNLSWDKFTGGLSGQLKVGVEQHFDETLDRSAAANISGGLGYAYELFKGFSVYSFLNVGTGYSRGEGYLFHYPEVGFSINNKWDMSTRANFSIHDNQRRSEEVLKSLSIRQTFYIKSNYSFQLEFDRRWNNTIQQNQFGMRFKYLF
jgi:hypothetical protein